MGPVTEIMSFNRQLVFIRPFFRTSDHLSPMPIQFPHQYLKLYYPSYSSLLGLGMEKSNAVGLGSFNCSLVLFSSAAVSAFLSPMAVSKLGRIPSSSLRVNYFTLIASLSGRLTVPSIRNYLSAVRNLHIVYGFSDPLSGLPRVPLVLKGIKHVQRDVRWVKMSITALVLLSMKLQLDFHMFGHVMFRAACCLAFFGFLRCSEFRVMFI